SGPGSGAGTAHARRPDPRRAAARRSGTRMNIGRVDGGGSPSNLQCGRPMQVPETSISLVVAAAWEPELVRFRELIRGGGSSSTGSGSGDDGLLVGIGIGIVEAAIGMTRCVMRHAPRAALLLGTAGAMPGSGLAVGDVVVARRV